MKRGSFPFAAPQRTQRPRRKEADFDQFEATELYCAKCGQAVPVNKFLLLVLPEGEKYEYRCQRCGSAVGDKIDRSAPFQGILTT